MLLLVAQNQHDVPILYMFSDEQLKLRLLLNKPPLSLVDMNILKLLIDILTGLQRLNKQVQTFILLVLLKCKHYIVQAQETIYW